jgi:hypothetical protein
MSHFHDLARGVVEREGGNLTPRWDTWAAELSQAR